VCDCIILYMFILYFSTLNTRWVYHLKIIHTRLAVLRQNIFKAAFQDRQYSSDKFAIFLYTALYANIDKKELGHKRKVLLILPSLFVFLPLQPIVVVFSQSGSGL